MIRKLTEQDREDILAYLSEEKDFNIFIIGDIENYKKSSRRITLPKAWVQRGRHLDDVSDLRISFLIGRSTHFSCDITARRTLSDRQRA